jgi:hypothetical protein
MSYTFVICLVPCFFCSLILVYIIEDPVMAYLMVHTFEKVIDATPPYFLVDNYID